jgi:hypothetical protein
MFENSMKIEKIPTFFTSNVTKFVVTNTNEYFNNYIDSRFDSNFTMGKMFNLSDKKPIFLNKNTSTSDNNNSNLNVITTDILVTKKVN